MRDVAGRLANCLQLPTDGDGPYLVAVEDAFPNDEDGNSAIDYSQLLKRYGTPDKTEQRRYSPSICTGSPDAALISTSYVGRSNLTVRMGMRRFTRPTNGL